MWRSGSYGAALSGMMRPWSDNSLRRVGISVFRPRNHIAAIEMNGVHLRPSGRHLSASRGERQRGPNALLRLAGRSDDVTDGLATAVPEESPQAPDVNASRPARDPARPRFGYSAVEQIPNMGHR